MTRHRLVAALAVATLTASGSAAQPPDGPLVGHLLPYLGDARLQADLKLTAAQLQTLLDHRTSPAADAEAFDRAVATARVFRRTLSPEQLERANRLAVRRIARENDVRVSDPPRIDGRRLAAVPGLAAALTLDRDQTAILAGRATASVYLTPAQSAALAEFVGPPGEVEWTADAPPRAAPPADVPTAPERPKLSPLRLHTAPDVRADLGLSAEQVRALAALADSVGADIPTPGGARVRSRLEAERLAEAVLTPAQRTRVRQLAAQRFEPPATDAFARPDLRQELDLDAEQLQAWTVVRAEFENAVGRAVLSGDTAGAVRRSLRDATATRHRALRDALTPAQRLRFDARFGEPFAGRYESARPVVLPTPATAAFGRYREELSILSSNRAVQDELKLTPDRVTSLRRADREGPRLPVDATGEELDDRSGYVARTLAGLLTPGQARRFRQIMLQRLDERPDQRPDSFHMPSVVWYPGVGEAVRLTPAQRERLFDWGHPLDVLTPEQQVAIRAMLGEPFRGDVRAPGRTPKQPGPRGRVLVELPWASVGMTPDTSSTVARALNVYSAAPARATAGPWNPTTDPSARLEAALAAALTGEELGRLDQLGLQFAFGQHPRATLTSWDTATRLGLTPDQLRSLYAVEQEWRQVLRVAAAVDLPEERRHDLLTRLRPRLDERLLNTLTPAQRATWAVLTGEPCPTVTRPVPRWPEGR